MTLVCHLAMSAHTRVCHGPPGRHPFPFQLQHQAATSISCFSSPWLELNSGLVSAQKPGKQDRGVSHLPLLCCKQERVRRLWMVLGITYCKFLSHQRASCYVLQGQYKTYHPSPGNCIAETQFPPCPV